LFVRKVLTLFFLHSLSKSAPFPSQTHDLCYSLLFSVPCSL
jgi:hypothetical protein